MSRKLSANPVLPRPARENDAREEERGHGEADVGPQNPAGLDPNQQHKWQGSKEDEQSGREVVQQAVEEAQLVHAGDA